MNKVVLDASAILSLIFDEAGSDRVAAVLDHSIVSSVNVAEVFSKFADKGLLSEAIVDDFSQLGIDVVDLDFEQAEIIGELRSKTKHLGLSLGDRACLALALVRKSTAITADTSWKKLKVCPVEVIR